MRITALLVKEKPSRFNTRQNTTNTRQNTTDIKFFDVIMCKDVYEDVFDNDVHPDLKLRKTNRKKLRFYVGCTFMNKMKR